MATQLDFLDSFIQQLFDDNGFEGLDEATRAQYLAMFTAEAQKRLGVALLPKLSPKQAKELIALSESADTSTEQYTTFWHAAVPDFDAAVEEVLANFSEEFQSLVGGK